MLFTNNFKIVKNKVLRNLILYAFQLSYIQRNI
jgi:hypothetical protein